MRRRMRLAAVVPTAVAVLGLSALPALADAAPADKDTTQSTTGTARPLGHAIGSASTLLVGVRALPGANIKLPNLPIPGLATGGPGGPALSLGVGLSNAKANTEASGPKSSAEAAPLALSLLGNPPTQPGSSSQTAPPDNASPTTNGIELPNNPLITGGLLRTSAHARFSDKLGPCVSPLSAARSSTADLKVLPVLPRITAAQTTDPSKLINAGALPKGVSVDQVTGPLQNLLGMFGGLGNVGAVGGKNGGAVVDIPGLLSTRSDVNLVPRHGSKNKAVQSTSQLRVLKLTLLQGTPYELTVRVISDPTLRATSTGKKGSSSVTYTKPLLQIYQGGKKIGVLDPSNSSLDVPISLVPVDTGLLNNLGLGKTGLGKTTGLSNGLNLEQVKALLSAYPGLANLMHVSNPSKLTAKQAAGLGAIPIIGDPNLSNLGHGLDQIPDIDLNLGVVRLQIGHKDDFAIQHVKGQPNSPFSGFEIGSVAHLLNLEVLPSKALNTGLLPKLPQVPNLPNLGDSLAQVVVGEQTARAYAPTNGVVCEIPAKPAPPKGQPSPKPPLAYTDAAYQAVPLFWTGSGLLLAGIVLVSIRPIRRRVFTPRHRVK